MRHAGSMALCIDKITGSRERNPMENCLKVGILGAGNIAGSMAEALNELQKEGVMGSMSMGGGAGEGIGVRTKMEYHKSIQQLRGTGIGSGSGPDLYSNTTFSAL